MKSMKLSEILEKIKAANGGKEPAGEIIEGEDLLNLLRKSDTRCNCIACRLDRGESVDPDDLEKVRKYKAEIRDMLKLESEGEYYRFKLTVSIRIPKEDFDDPTDAAINPAALFDLLMMDLNWHRSDIAKRGLEIARKYFGKKPIEQ